MDRSDNVNDTTITRMGLRSGGWIGYNEEGIYINREDETRIKIKHGNVTQVGLRNADWGVVVMSVLLVGIGAFVGTTRNLLVGIGFAAIGLVSIYWSYRKRYKLVIHVENERTPISVYPTHPTKCHETLAERIRVGIEN